MKTIESMAEHINYIANVKHLGGRCTAVDSTRCILYDSANWTHAMQNHIKRMYPTCCIQISALESSISGFVVIFDLNEPDNRMSNTFLVLGFISILAVITYYVFHFKLCEDKNNNLSNVIPDILCM